MSVCGRSIFPTFCEELTAGVSLFLAARVPDAHMFSHIHTRNRALGVHAWSYTAIYALFRRVSFSSLNSAESNLVMLLFISLDLIPDAPILPWKGQKSSRHLILCLSHSNVHFAHSCPPISVQDLNHLPLALLCKRSRTL